MILYKNWNYFGNKSKGNSRRTCNSFRAQGSIISNSDRLGKAFS